MSFDFSDNEYMGTADALKISQWAKASMKDWSMTTRSNGMMAQWYRNYRMYYNMRNVSFSPNAGTGLAITGDNGQNMSGTFSHFRNIITHWMNMVFAKPPVPKCMAENADPESISAVALYDSIIQHETRVHRLTKYFRNTSERGLIFGTGAFFCEWDPMAGEPVTVEGDNVVYSGDISPRALTPFDFRIDPRITDWNDAQWVSVRDYANKFELATRYPEFADRIVNLKPDPIDDQLKLNIEDTRTDMVPVIKTYFKRIDGLLPQGRYVITLDVNLCVHDGPNPYDRLPVFLLKPQEWMGTIYGYTLANDLVPVQQAHNLVTSQLMTQVAHYGVPSVMYQEGSGMSPTRLSGGMRGFAVPAGAMVPQPLSMLSNIGELVQLSSIFEKTMETLSGVNSVARGDPDKNLKAGVALGIVQSQAIQFSSGFQNAVIELYTDVWNFILDLHKRFCSAERVVAIAGKSKAEAVKRWKSSDIMPVYGIYVEPQDPMSQSMAGRMEMAKDLLSNNIVHTAQQYLTVTHTGNMEDLIAPEQAELDYIKRETESLMGGQPVRVLATDNHQLHIADHLKTTFDVETRASLDFDPEGARAASLQATLMHVQQHLDYLNPPAPPENEETVAAGGGEPPPQMPKEQAA